MNCIYVNTKRGSCRTGSSFYLDSAGGRARTDTVSPPRDFKSRASAYSATPAMGGGGFEPPKHKAADLQSVPFGRSGNHPHRSIFLRQSGIIS